VRTAIIINAASGRTAHERGAGADRLHLARRAAASCASDATVVLTNGPGHAATLARSFVADHVARVVAWGGDGTVNEVAGPLIGTNVALGIVPGGSGNGAAGSLGLVRPTLAALETALTAAPRTIDVGWLGDRHFLNIAGVGFDAEVARAFNRQRRRGLLSYLRVGLPLLWRYTPASYHLQLGSTSVDGTMMFIAIANGSQYGNGLVLAPDANPADGILNIVALHAAPPMQSLWQTRLLLFPTARPTPGVDRHRTATCEISGARLLCHVDGESFEAADTVQVRIQPAALRIAGARTTSSVPVPVPRASADGQ